MFLGSLIPANIVDEDFCSFNINYFLLKTEAYYGAVEIVLYRPEGKVALRSECRSTFITSFAYPRSFVPY
jgi:hypothetical protein